MPEYKELCEWSRPGYVSELRVFRECDQGIAKVTVYLKLEESDFCFN